MSAPEARALAERLREFAAHVETHPTVDEPGVVAAYVLVGARDVDTFRDAAAELERLAALEVVSGIGSANGEATAERGKRACPVSSTATDGSIPPPIPLAARPALDEEAVDALRWLVNIACGVGKRGGPPEPYEFEEAVALGKRVLARLAGGTP